MDPMNVDIFADAKENEAFRRVVATGQHSQVVLMTVPPGGDIGEEVHHVDQTLVFVEGDGSAIISGETTPIHTGSLAFVPAGTKHNFVNTGSSPLRLFTIYAPPQHAPGTVQQTKADAEAAQH